MDISEEHKIDFNDLNATEKQSEDEIDIAINLGESDKDLEEKKHQTIEESFEIRGLVK
jgi:hypothetical protein